MWVEYFKIYCLSTYISKLHLKLQLKILLQTSSIYLFGNSHNDNLQLYLTYLLQNKLMYWKVNSLSISTSICIILLQHFPVKEAFFRFWKCDVRVRSIVTKTLFNLLFPVFSSGILTFTVSTLLEHIRVIYSLFIQLNTNSINVNNNTK